MTSMCEMKNSTMNIQKNVFAKMSDPKNWDSIKTIVTSEAITIINDFTCSRTSPLAIGFSAKAASGLAWNSDTNPLEKTLNSFKIDGYNTLSSSRTLPSPFRLSLEISSHESLTMTSCPSI